MEEESSQKPHLNPHLKRIIAGFFGGLANVTSGHPFETIGARAATINGMKSVGPLQILRDTVQSEGFSALYKGAMAPYLVKGTLTSMMFYSKMLTDPLFTPYDNGKLSLSQHFWSGTLSGSLVSWMYVPMDHVKARLQLQYDHPGLGALPRYSGTGIV